MGSRLDDLGSWVQILAGTRNLFSSRQPDQLCGQLSLYCWVTSPFVVGVGVVKPVKVWGWPSAHSAKIKNEWFYLHLSYCLQVIYGEASASVL